MTPSDNDLLRQFATAGPTGDAAFGQLVERHKNWVYSTCFRRLAPRTDLAEDAAQAVFIALASKAPSLINHHSIPGWLYQAARYVSMDARKLEARRAKREAEVAHMIAFATPPASDTADTWSAIAPRLEPALDRLPEKYRLPLILRFYQQKTAAQIARELSISEPAAQKRITRGLEKLRTRLAPSTPLASISAALLAHNIHVAPATLTAVAIHSAGAASVAATSLTLSQGALKMMLIAKIKTAAALAVSLATVVLCSVFIPHLLAQQPAAPAAPTAVEPVAAPAAPAELPPGFVADQNYPLIAPYIADDAVMVVHIDTTHVDTGALETIISETIQAVPTIRPADAEMELKKIQATRLAIDGFIARGKTLGVTDFYACITSGNTVQPFAVLVPHKLNVDVKALTALLETVQMGNVVALNDRILAIVPQQNADALATLKSSLRPDLEQALARPDNTGIQIAVTLSEAVRKELERHSPTFPREIGGGSISLLSQSFQRAGVSITLPPESKVTAIAYLDTPEHARAAADLFVRTVETVSAKLLGLPESHVTVDPGEGSIRDRIRKQLNPVVEGSTFKIEIDAAGTREAFNLAIVLPYQAKVKNAPAFPNVQATLAACTKYAAAKNEWPHALHDLVESKFLPDDSTFSDPVTNQPLEYHPWSPDELKLLDPAATPVLWARSVKPNIAFPIGYADGHITFNNQLSLKRQIEQANAKLNNR